MFDHAPFIAAIVAHPFNDVPRRAYADELETHGDCDHAEFIRVQLQIAEQRDPARRPQASKANDRFQDVLQARERELFKDSGPAWWDALPGAYRATAVDARLADVRIETADGWTYVIRRGFPEELTITAEAIVGAPCRRCEGMGTAAVYDDGNHGIAATRRCSACKGMMVTPGIAAELFRLAPTITAVRLTGKRPESSYALAMDVGDAGKNKFWWFDPNVPPLRQIDDYCRIPPALIRHMPSGGAAGFLGQGQLAWRCDGKNVAEEALSRACVDFGRAEAGLPPLAWPPLPAPRAGIALRDRESRVDIHVSDAQPVALRHGQRVWLDDAGRVTRARRFRDNPPFGVVERDNGDGTARVLTVGPGDVLRAPRRRV